jgi:uncharacterized protein (DUF2267 family)
MEPLSLFKEVADRTGLDRTTATFATTALLRAIGLGLSPADAERLRGQLPDPLGDLVRPEPGVTFHWSEFINRVVKPDASPSEPRRLAEQLLDVLRSHVDEDVRPLLVLPSSFPSEQRVEIALARMRGEIPGSTEADEEIARVVAQRDARYWQSGAKPGEWVMEVPDRGRGQVRWADWSFEARVWRWNTGPTPAPPLELTNGPTVFGDANGAVDYVEDNLLGV